MIKEAVDLDAMFIFSKGDQPALEFISMLDIFFFKSFSMKIKMEVINIFVSLLIQFFNFPENELSNR